MFAVEMSHVTKIIKKSTVLSDINLTIREGSVTGLQGINGSGKTMLMRLIAGLIKPTSGTVAVHGLLLKKGNDFPDSIGLLIENPAFLDAYSGFHNLKLIASIRNKISDEEIEKTLSDVGLAEAKHKKYKKYSLGMKQRLGIAAAIMEHPKIILLDEPTNALDEQGVEMVKKIVKRENSAGATMIISCHDREILLSMTNEIVNMELGKIVHT